MTSYTLWACPEGRGWYVPLGSTYQMIPSLVRCPQEHALWRKSPNRIRPDHASQIWFHSSPAWDSWPLRSLPPRVAEILPQAAARHARRIFLSDCKSFLRLRVGPAILYWDRSILETVTRFLSFVRLVTRRTVGRKAAAGNDPRPPQLFDYPSVPFRHLSRD